MNASRISQTPNSMKRMIQTPFKMPWSNHSQKKLSFSSRLFGEPPAKKIMSSNFNSSASRPRYCASVMNSTSKKSSTVRPNRTDRSSIGGQANKYIFGIHWIQDMNFIWHYLFTLKFLIWQIESCSEFVRSKNHKWNNIHEWNDWG